MPCGMCQVGSNHPGIASECSVSVCFCSPLCVSSEFTSSPKLSELFQLNKYMNKHLWLMLQSYKRKVNHRQVSFSRYGQIGAPAFTAHCCQLLNEKLLPKAGFIPWFRMCVCYWSGSWCESITARQLILRLYVSVLLGQPLRKVCSFAVARSLDRCVFVHHSLSRHRPHNLQQNRSGSKQQSCRLSGDLVVLVW